MEEGGVLVSFLLFFVGSGGWGADCGGGVGRPKQFPKEEELEDSEESEEESTVGKMPPGSDDEE